MNDVQELKPLDRLFRFWPVYAVAFARTFSYTIYGLALPNYLIYSLRFSPSLIGIIISIQSFAFILGPLAALPITKRFGIRNTVLFSSIASVILVGCQILFFNPWVLIAFRALDGFFTGFFWPNLQMEISNWQRHSPLVYANGFFKTYANSWGFGILFGQGIGCLIVFFGEGNDYTALVFSWMAMILMIPFAFMMEKSHISLHYSLERGYARDLKSLQLRTGQSIESNKNQDSSMLGDNKSSQKDEKFLLGFPALFYLFGTLIYAYLKTFYPFIYPLYLAEAGIPSYWVYFTTLLHQFIQMIFIAVWSVKDAKSGYHAWWLAMILNIVCLGCLIFYVDIWVLTLFFIFNGAITAFFYSLTSKIMLQYGNSTGSLKFATYYEFFNGIGFGFAPLIAGFISDINLELNFSITLTIFIGFSALLYFLSTTPRKMLRRMK